MGWWLPAIDSQSVLVLADLPTGRLTDFALALSLEECQQPAYNTSRTSSLEHAGGPVPH
jgi:hypothetical protein